VLLGAAFLGEPLGLRTLVAGAAIVASVVLIVSGGARRPSARRSKRPRWRSQRPLAMRSRSTR
jgi:drug/metabolite transporter (DMT)-like permease